MSLSSVYSVRHAERSFVGRAAACAALLFATACSLDSRRLELGTGQLGGDASPLPVPDSGGGATPGTGGRSSTDGGAGGTVTTPDGAPPSGEGGSQPPPGVTCFHRGEDGGLDCADTLLENADFNRDHTHWAGADAFGKIEWRAEDSQDSKYSGSLAVINTYQAPNNGQAPSEAVQCIPITSGDVYTFTAEAFIAEGQTYGFGVLDVWFYRAENCSGLPEGVYAVTNTDVVGTWVSMAPGSLTGPVDRKSAGIRVGAQKPIRGEAPFEVLFDAVRVTRTQN